MSARYLRCVIQEQIDRAKSLKADIPTRQRHAALERLAAACRVMLEEQLRLLERAAGMLDNGDTDGVGTKAVRALKRCTRVIDAVEGCGMPPRRHSEQARLSIAGAQGWTGSPRLWSLVRRVHPAGGTNAAWSRLQGWWTRRCGCPARRAPG